MQEPLVSILTTIYNRALYLPSAIESVLAQTYSNWELILVDDGSTDKSVEIAKEYSNKDPRIKFFQNPKNLGDYPNRNQAAKHASGKYLKYLDADDLLYPHGLEVMVRAIEAFPEAGFALCRPDEDIIPMPYILTPKEAYTEHFFRRALFTNSPLGAIIKRSAFEEVGGFTGTRFVGDMEMWLELGAKFPVVKMVEGLGFWRSHGDQEVVKGWEKMEYPPLLVKLHEHFIFRNECPLTLEQKKLAWERYRKGILKMVLRKASRFKIVEAFKLAKAYQLL